MKIPVWIIAIAFVVGVAFIGYGIYDNREVDLWPPKIHPRNHEIITASDIKYLNNFPSVLEQATNLIRVAEVELWIAVDVPAYGAITANKEYEIYENALQAAAIQSNINKHILWFDKETEYKYNTRVANLNTKEMEIANVNGERLRKAFEETTGTDLPVLAFHNFWIAKDKNGTYHSLVAWFALDEVRSSDLIGIYSTSPQLAELLKGVWGMWKKQTKDNFSKSLSVIYGP